MSITSVEKHGHYGRLFQRFENSKDAQEGVSHKTMEIYESAWKLKDRPAFMEMLTALHANGVKQILIERLDRLARSLAVQESIIAELKRHGFELISAEEPDLLKDNPYRVMFRQFQGAIAQCEKANIVLKLRGARQRMKARTGRCEGRKPYGAHEGEQAIIDRMYELRASGMAYDRIAATLNNDGVPTRTPGKRWHGFAVNKILTRPPQLRSQE